MKNLKRIVSLLLCVLMLLGSLQLSGIAAADRNKAVQSLPFVTISDLHIFPDSEQGDRTQDWLDVCRLDGKMFNESETIIRTALKTAAVNAKKQGLSSVMNCIIKTAGQSF